MVTVMAMETWAAAEPETETETSMSVLAAATVTVMVTATDLFHLVRISSVRKTSIAWRSMEARLSAPPTNAQIWIALKAKSALRHHWGLIVRT
jgi:hypothetical protein